MNRPRYITLTWLDVGTPIELDLVEAHRCPHCGATPFLWLDAMGWARPETHAPVQCQACEFAYAMPVHVERRGVHRVRVEARERSWRERLKGSLRGLWASVKGVLL